jgi:hypothetical protein
MTHFHNTWQFSKMSGLILFIFYTAMRYHGGLICIKYNFGSLRRYGNYGNFSANFDIYLSYLKDGLWTDFVVQ